MPLDCCHPPTILSSPELFHKDHPDRPEKVDQNNQNNHFEQIDLQKKSFFLSTAHKIQSVTPMVCFL